MAFAEALLNFLDNPDEPLPKRLKLADNTFISADVPLQQKETFLFKWVLKCSNNAYKNQEELLDLLVKWTQSEQFGDLSWNDVRTSDVVYIFDVLIEKVRAGDLEDSVKDKIVNVTLSLLSNKIIQDYFKHDTEKYCQVVSTLSDTKSAQNLLEILKKPGLFASEVTAQDKFYKHFLGIVLPTLVQKWIQFENEKLFLEISKVVQKCIFYNQISNFGSYFSQFFENTPLDASLEKKVPNIPKTVLKHLCSCYEHDSQSLRANFKLIFHSFCNSFKHNSTLIYQFLILVLHTIGFDLSSTFKLCKSTKIKSQLGFQKSLEVYDVLLETLDTNSFSVDSKFQNFAFIDFNRNILKSIVSYDLPCTKVYEIILKSIKIHPLVIEPIVGQIISFATLSNNENKTETYEKLVIAILEVFAKLHRIQNFVSRMIPELKISLDGKNGAAETYQFIGNMDVRVSSEKNLVVTSMFTDNILEYFTRCVCDLASWQVINLFKTLLFHLKEAVQEFSDSEDTQDKNKLIFIEILGTLTCRLLQSSKMADHTVTANTVEKFVKGLEELKAILENFGSAILKREHNPTTMRTFLSLGFNWAEIYMTLTYYSPNQEVKITRVVDKTYSACNLMYLHSYLDLKQWQLISQRITNFGEYPCKRLLQKLYIQKIKALMLFENNFSDEILANVVKEIQDHMDETWKDFLSDKFVVHHLFPKMDEKSKLFLADNLLKHESLCDLPYIINSVDVVNILIYATMSNITKMLTKHKKKQGVNNKEFLSAELFVKIPNEFYLGENFKAKDVSENVTKKLWTTESSPDISSSEEKVEKHLTMLKRIPFIYANVELQKTVLVYVFCLHRDVSSVEKLGRICEDLVIGILQSGKFSVTEILDIEKVFLGVLQNFERHEQVFSLVLNNALKEEENLKKVEFCADCLLTHAEDPKYLTSCVKLFKGLNKLPKSKTNSELKNELKEKIAEKITEHISNSDHSIEAYAICLKHYLSMNDGKENLKKLLKKLPAFIKLSLSNEITRENISGNSILFLTVLHNKQKIGNLEEDFVLQVWKWLKNVGTQFSDLEDYSQLVKLVVTLIPNEEFHVIVEDLLKLTVQNIELKNTPVLTKQLKIWESILTCNVNPLKITIWQQTVEIVVQSLLDLLKSSEFNEELFKSVVHFEESVVQTHHFILSSNLMDSLLITPTILMTYHGVHFEETYYFSIALLEKLLSHRNALIMDRLPAFLQQYRILLKALCDKSNSELNLEPLGINKMADLAHRMEKLTKNLVACKKDMSRIALYLVADILERYEQINLYSNVKLHLNNCIYSLLSLCDHHAVSYLMRVLSSASTEMFKIMYEHYKKYYMFTGKV